MRTPRVWLAVMTVTIAGCSAQAPTARRAAPARVTMSAGEPKHAPHGWAAETLAPWPAAALDEVTSRLLAGCGVADQGLLDTARVLAEHLADHAGAELDLQEIGFALRRRGVPYVWPRVWSLEGRNLLEPDAASRLPRWVEALPAPEGERRCGVGHARRADGRETLAALVVDALAMLEPIPTEVRLGAWVEVEARLLRPATAAKVVVLGPRGSPRGVPTRLRGDRVGARFAADRPGTWLVQVVATMGGGPRPVLEALVSAGEAPPSDAATGPAPGEQPDAPPTADALAAMVAAARREDGLPELRRDDTLDRVAADHARAMQRVRKVAHDVGNGDPGERVAAAGVEARRVGENVARARSLGRAHRALWASPSHRGNLLERRFDHLGVGVATDADGTVWAVQVFAALR